VNVRTFVVDYPDFIWSRVLPQPKSDRQRIDIDTLPPEDAGVEFIAENGGGAGVRIRKPVTGKSGK
jgi:hypothetical protein